MFWLRSRSGIIDVFRCGDLLLLLSLSMLLSPRALVSGLLCGGLSWSSSPADRNGGPFFVEHRCELLEQSVKLFALILGEGSALPLTECTSTDPMCKLSHMCPESH